MICAYDARLLHIRDEFDERDKKPGAACSRKVLPVLPNDQLAKFLHGSANFFLRQGGSAPAQDWEAVWHNITIYYHILPASYYHILA
jgi:hypothetical protein